MRYLYLRLIKILFTKSLKNSPVHTRNTNKMLFLKNNHIFVVYQVSQEFSRSDVPELDGAVVRRGDDELRVELKASHGRLVLVRTCKKEKKLKKL